MILSLHHITRFVRRVWFLKNEPEKNRLLLPALFVAIYANWTPLVISGLLLIEIAESFNAPVGVTGQISTLSSTLAIIGSILAGLISSKYGPRKILLAGLTLHLISALGCGIAPTLSILFITFATSGLALSIVGPMIETLVGENIPLKQRPNAMGLIISAATLTFIFGSPIVGFLENLNGWRLGFLAYYLPIVIVAIIVAYRVIPESDTASSDVGLFSGIRGVLFNGSARSCLLGMALTAATYYSLFYYSISFFRVRFEIPLTWASILVSGINLISVGGAMSAGRLLNRFGRKTSSVFGCLLAGLSSIVYVFAPSFLVSLSVVLLGAFIAGFRINAITSLSLEQVPEFRGSMMSLNSAFMNLGSVLGAGIGGYALLRGNWTLMGVSIGVLGILAALTIQLGARDPTRNR
jgi:predicted MFS family arabinose efflux permease